LNKINPIRSHCLLQSYKNALKQKNVGEILIYFGQMTKIFLSDKTRWEGRGYS